MLKKHAFQIAVVYGTKIATQELHISKARALRDLMKPFMDFATVFEADRNAIFANEKLTDEMKKEEFQLLQDESVELNDNIPDLLLAMAEEQNLKLTSGDIAGVLAHKG